MKNPSKVILATAALITLHSTAGWSESILQITQSGTQEEISKPLIDTLVATGRLNEPEEESVRSHIERFVP